MLDYIQGTLKELSPSSIVVEVSGLGYRIFIPLNLFGKLPHLENSVKLYLSEVIREDHRSLYGFINQSDRNLFEALREVSGIGPKSALALIGFSSDSNALLHAIETENLALISKTPGIGKKTAARLIVEMKDKARGFLSPETTSFFSDDSLNALTNLGYSRSSASSAIKKAREELPESPDLSLLITTALKHIRN